MFKTTGGSKYTYTRNIFNKIISHSYLIQKQIKYIKKKLFEKKISEIELYKGTHAALDYFDLLQKPTSNDLDRQSVPKFGSGEYGSRTSLGRTAAFDRWQASYRTVSCSDTSLSVAVKKRRSCAGDGDKSGISQRRVYRTIYSFQQPRMVTTAGS